MIARAILFFLMFSALFYLFLYAAFRTAYFSKRRVIEIVKTGSITIAAVVLSIGVIVALLNIDKLS